MKVRRLQKLAKFLEEHDFNDPDAGFDFGTWVKGESSKHPCGTTACAIGWMPVVDPENWKYIKSKKDEDMHHWALPVLKGIVDFKYKPDNICRISFTCPHINVSAYQYFGIDEVEFSHLFKPNAQKPMMYGGTYLGVGAGPKQVARNIRDFIKMKRKNNGS